MSGFTLTRSRIRAGLYEGELVANGRNLDLPRIELVLLGEHLADAKITPNATDARRWLVEARIPPSALSDGTLTFLLRTVDGHDTLDAFAVVAGEPLHEDLRAEIDLIRAELDMLKRAFRSHCAAGN